MSSTWRKCHVTGLTMGRTDTSGSGIRYTDVEDFRLEATWLRTAQEGAIFDTCIVGDVYLQILNPSAQTDNTYDGIDLIDCDRLNLFGLSAVQWTLRTTRGTGSTSPRGTCSLTCGWRFQGRRPGTLMMGQLDK